MAAAPAEPESDLPDAERMKFFTDAVVAIAMTLLILPLLEGVTEAAREGMTAGDYVAAYEGALLSFGLSFVLIARFWVGHEQLFRFVGAWNGRLMAVNLAWMLTIVFLPVATAMLGALPGDRTEVAIYVGTLWLTSLAMLGLNVVVRAHPALWKGDDRPGPQGVAASIALLLFFALAFVIAMFLPTGSRYLAMFVLFLSGPATGAINRRLSP